MIKVIPQERAQRRTAVHIDVVACTVRDLHVHRARELVALDCLDGNVDPQFLLLESTLPGTETSVP